MEQIVSVYGEKIAISVYQKSKTVWIAVGDYMGERLEVKSTSRSSAAAHWVAAARYRGN